MLYGYDTNVSEVDPKKKAAIYKFSAKGLAVVGCLSVPLMSVVDRPFFLAGCGVFSLIAGFNHWAKGMAWEQNKLNCLNQRLKSWKVNSLLRKRKKQMYWSEPGYRLTLYGWQDGVEVMEFRKSLYSDELSAFHVNVPVTNVFGTLYQRIEVVDSITNKWRYELISIDLQDEEEKRELHVLHELLLQIAKMLPIDGEVRVLFPSAIRKHPTVTAEQMTSPGVVCNSRFPCTVNRSYPAIHHKAD